MTTEKVLKSPSKMKQFVHWLEHLGESKNTRAYAIMRRALSESKPENYLPAAAYIEPFLGSAYAEDAFSGYSKKARVYYLLAGLYCLVNRAGDVMSSDNNYESYQNFGWTLALLHKQKFPQATGEEPTSLEQRFLALLQSDEEQLVYFIRQMVSQAKEQPINWVQLGDDLLKWNELTRRRWAQSFYQNYRESKKGQ